MSHRLIDKLRKYGSYVEYEPKCCIKQVFGFLLSFHDGRIIAFHALKLRFSFYLAKCAHLTGNDILDGSTPNMPHTLREVGCLLILFGNCRQRVYFCKCKQYATVTLLVRCRNDCLSMLLLTSMVHPGSITHTLQ